MTTDSGMLVCRERGEVDQLMGFCVGDTVVLKNRIKMLDGYKGSGSAQGDLRLT